MSLASWSLFVGALLVTMVLAGTLLGRLPLTGAMVYLGLGALLGPAALDVLRPDPYRYTEVLQLLTEVGLLISLFAVGLRLGVPLRDPRWWLPMRLAFVSMTAMVAMVAALGVWLLQLPLGAAVLLGAILAPTDPVLAADLPVDAGSDPERLGFCLAGEGALNDGAAFPFVMLGLGLMGAHDLGPGGSTWWGLDLIWATFGGVAIGGLLGSATGQLVVFLRSRHGEAVGLDVFLGLGLVGMSYGIALLCLASGFLAVFAAGLALQRVREVPRPHSRPLAAAPGSQGHTYETLATHSHHASATMRESVQGFNKQFEKLAELTLVLLVGAMLAYAPALPGTVLFVALMLLVLRPISVAVATVGSSLSLSQRAMVGWFGIRGIGSVFYLLLALHQGLGTPVTDVLLTLTLWTVAASIVAHGVTAQPLMQRYLATRKQRRKPRPTLPHGPKKPPH